MKRYKYKELNEKHQKYDGKTVFLDYPPKWVTIGLTGSCYFKCDFCCSHSPDSGKNPITNHQYKMPFQINTQDFKKIVNLCYQGGVPRIHLCGTGEPFIHPKITQLIDYAITAYSCISLQTDFAKRIFQKHSYVNEIIRRKNNINYITTDIFPFEIHETIKKGSDLDYLLWCLKKISRETDINFNANVILSKRTYKGLSSMVEELVKAGIKFFLNIVNLFPLGFNSFTSIDNVYMSHDLNITNELSKVKRIAQRHNINYSIPLPWDLEINVKSPCLVFWEKIQTMPSKKLAKSRWIGNAIPQQCPAVVAGSIKSIGNLLDYSSFMDFWNNEKLLEIRKNIIAGNLADEACGNCCNGYNPMFNKIANDNNRT